MSDTFVTKQLKLKIMITRSKNCQSANMQYYNIY